MTPLTADDQPVHVHFSHHRTTHQNCNLLFYPQPLTHITSHYFTVPGSKCQNIFRWTQPEPQGLSCFPRVTLQTTTRRQHSLHDRHPADDPEPRCRHQRESGLGSKPRTCRLGRSLKTTSRGSRVSKVLKIEPWPRPPPQQTKIVLMYPSRLCPPPPPATEDTLLLSHGTADSGEFLEERFPIRNCPARGPTSQTCPCAPSHVYCSQGAKLTRESTMTSSHILLPETLRLEA